MMGECCCDSDIGVLSGKRNSVVEMGGCRMEFDKGYGNDMVELVQ